MLRFVAAFLFSSLLPVTTFAQQAADAVAPEIASSQEIKSSGKPVQSQSWMVAVAHPLAAKAAADVLREGGTAGDAAIAAQFMLGLVEPQSSGLGGGAFFVHFDAASGTLSTLDGRETAPLAATPQLFQDEQGEPLKFFDAVVGGRSVGTPGTPALLAAIHQRHGKLDWARLIAPAKRTARQGFRVSPRMAASVEADAERLARHPATATYFLPDGEPIPVHTLLKNEPYAQTLTMLENGVEPFYRGSIAEEIVTTVQSFAANPGVLSMADLAAYEVKQREPVCAAYRGHDVCGMGPPSSGALTVGQILGQIEQFNFAEMGPLNVKAWLLIGDSSRLAFADRGRYMADSDYVPMPTKGLVDPAYLSNRGALLAGEMALTEVAPGQPEWDHAALDYADDESLELPSTSHFSIVDAAGNAVSMTTTIENGFGSRLMVAGFLLNNELTDFSFRSHRDGTPIANRVEPGKRPRSSMAPTIVMKDGKPVFVVGSPGGSRIIGYVAQTIINHIDWGMDPQLAVAAPHLVNRFGTFDLEESTSAIRLQEALEELGYEVNARPLTSGLHAIAITPDGLEGGADPRREGIVIGE
jgi:gamma-glutamyltranspeptidase/glutathione hydrolase